MARHPKEPWHQPQHGGKSECEKEWPPTEASHGGSSRKHAEGWTESQSSDDERIGRTAARSIEVRGEDFAVGGEGDRLSDPQDHTDDEQSGEPMQHSGDGRGCRPQEKSGCEYPLYIEPIDQPSRWNLHQGVDPEERG